MSRRCQRPKNKQQEKTNDAVRVQHTIQIGISEFLTLTKSPYFIFSQMLQSVVVARPSENNRISELRSPS
jgi:hypothetical protein